MLPSSNNDGLKLDFEEVFQPSKTYKLDLERKQIVGYVDGKEAIKQFIYKILSTERYQYLIYSWNYGAELDKLFGQPIPYVYSEIKRLITEALTQDDRILSVDAFSFSHKRNKVFVSFTAHTIFGDIEVTKEVTIA